MGMDMYMEKQGVVREDITPAEDPDDLGARPSIDKLADDHTISRLIQKMGRDRWSQFKPRPKPQGG